MALCLPAILFTRSADVLPELAMELIESTGILLIIAKLDADGDGKLSPAEMKDFCDNIESMAENEMGFATTVMIVSTL